MDTSLSDLFSTNATLSDIQAAGSTSASIYQSLGGLIGGGSSSSPTIPGTVKAAPAANASTLSGLVSGSSGVGLGLAAAALFGLILLASRK